MSSAAQVELSKRILETEQTRHFSYQRQRAQVVDGKAIAYRRIVFCNFGEHLLDLSLNAVFDGLRWRRIAEFIFVDGLQTIVRVPIAPALRTIHGRGALSITEGALTNYRPAG